MSQAKLEWIRVWNFGSHTHLIVNNKTICGRDVSNYTQEVHKFPTKKCKRCNEMAFMFSKQEKLVTA